MAMPLLLASKQGAWRGGGGAQQPKLPPFLSFSFSTSEGEREEEEEEEEERVFLSSLVWLRGAATPAPCLFICSRTAQHSTCVTPFSSLFTSDIFFFKKQKIDNHS